MNRQKIIIVLALIGALSIPIVALKITSNSNSKKPSTSKITQIEEPAELDICKAITPNKLKNILNINFKEPSITKASIGGGLSSDTCSFIASPGDPKNNLQIIVRYADSESSSKVDETWKNTTKDLQNKTTINDIGKESFISKMPSGTSTLYMRNKDNFLTITSASATDEQLIAIVQDIK